jgi:hypothetical protein
MSWPLASLAYVLCACVSLRPFRSFVKLERLSHTSTQATACVLGTPRALPVWCTHAMFHTMLMLTAQVNHTPLPRVPQAGLQALITVQAGHPGMLLLDANSACTAHDRISSCNKMAKTVSLCFMYHTVDAMCIHAMMAWPNWGCVNTARSERGRPQKVDPASDADLVAQNTSISSYHPSPVHVQSAA